VKPVIFDPDADAELAHALAGSPIPGDFRIAADDALAQIAAHPQLAVRVPRTTCRRYVLTRFPYSIVYRDDTTVIRVIAFPHHRQRPGYWKRGLRGS
jgi:toxin ParE1/3/4